MCNVSRQSTLCSVLWEAPYPPHTPLIHSPTLSCLSFKGTLDTDIRESSTADGWIHDAMEDAMEPVPPTGDGGGGGVHSRLAGGGRVGGGRGQSGMDTPQGVRWTPATGPSNSS